MPDNHIGDLETWVKAGSVKAIGDYAAAKVQAKANGFSDALYLDSVHKRYLQETSTTNVFLVKDKRISTPAPQEGTVLPGITRKCVIEIARSHEYQEYNASRLQNYENLQLYWSCFDEGKGFIETLMFEYHRQHEIRFFKMVFR